MPASSFDDASSAWVLRSKKPRVEIYGLTTEERLLRSLARAGCTSAELVTPDARPALPRAKSVVVVRGDAILDERLVAGLVARPGALLVARGPGLLGGHVPSERAEELVHALASGVPPEGIGGVPQVSPAEFAPAYVASLRKREAPFALLAAPERAREIEERIFGAAYKGVTDLVTKWIWPRPALWATRVCARAGVHPNTVTIASWVLAIGAVGLFATGWFGTGLLVAWLMTFLDTVDGKLARVTLTSSRLGDVLDHGLDLVHPPFWYAAWGLGLGAGYELATAIAVGGYLLGRLQEGIFLAAFEIEMHSWHPLDALFRTITARRNPNLILLSVGTLGGRPDLGLVMVALWTLVSLGFHAIRMLQAFARRRRGEAVAAWDTGATPEPREPASSGALTQR
ncbi:MAG: CDP-alcohol phosphatidyltransferase family protein [Myxococcales bacterium]|nr:CDP-alcohol phosphatidyltransferase family protein [Myxococcales bacterium]MDH5308129.1 CDP-alcohol phosphatidyltransferase family protein [Myxococcales bacterium]MDH5565110.1 CDP-alcohol phosphatidyltransferase family protein [Myxococcales bacterium]